MSLLPLQWFGWRVQSDTVSVEWDSEENVEQVRQRISFLTHGCSYKTGCSTHRCKCVKAGQHCGPGCSCTICQNRSTGTRGSITILNTYLCLSISLSLDITLGDIHEESEEETESESDIGMISIIRA